VSNRALYRKYRSKNLQEVVGQQHIVQVLDAAVHKERISHAYLFTGPRGVGKTSIARIFAHQINNIEYKDEATHLDIIEIDAASNSGVDDMRDLKDKIGSLPSSLKYKVYIIDEVHMLSGASFAALLKTIEEPPSHAVFILATTDAHKVPATIMSRVQKFFFKPIEPAEIKKHLQQICNKENIKFNDDALELISASSEGSMRDALSLLDQVSSGTKEVTLKLVQSSLGLAEEDLLGKLSQSVISGNLEEIPEALKDIIANGADPRALGLQIYQHLKPHLKNYDDFTILGELLTIGSLSKPTLGIEIILLRIASTKGITDSTTKNERTQALHIPAPEVITVPTKEISKAKKKLDKSSQTKKLPEEDTKDETDQSLGKLTSRSLSEEWSNIINNIALKSPSLKAILKPSKQKLTEKSYTLTIELAYPMHHKMVQENKNKQVLIEAFKNCKISLPKIDFIISTKPSQEKLKKDSEHDNSKSPEDDISDIISLMGGGEPVGI